MSITIPYAPTIQTDAYVAGDAIGSQAFELEEVFTSPGSVSYLKNMVVYDQDDEKAAISFYFFNQDPTGTTVTDGAALDVADADLDKIVARAIVVAGDYESFADNAVGEVEVTKEMQGGGTTSLWVIPVMRGTPTYTAATDLKFLFAFMRE